MVTFRYAPEILARYPTVVGGVMLSSGLVNGPASDELRVEYAAEQEAVRERIGETPLSQLPSLAAWRSVFRDFVEFRLFRLLEKSLDSSLRIMCGRPAEVSQPYPNLHFITAPSKIEKITTVRI